MTSLKCLPDREASLRVDSFELEISNGFISVGAVRYPSLRGLWDDER